MNTSTSRWGAAQRRSIFLFVAALVAGSGFWRLTASWWSGAGLFVDEAQYWDWSRDLAWGYFSKPPVLPSLMRLSTWIGGDSLTGVRWLVVFVWTLTPLVIWRLTRNMLRDSTYLDLHTRLIAGAWAAALCSAMLAFALLGQVSTTDGPLLFFWPLTTGPSADPCCQASDAAASHRPERWWHPPRCPQSTQAKARTMSKPGV